MAATLAQLRTQTAFWLDDPKKTKFDDGFLNTLIGIAYPLVVSVVESAGRLWNMSRTRIGVAIDQTAREYVIDAAHVIRKPIEVHRVEGITTVAAITNTLRRTRMPLRPFTEAQTAAPYPALENSYVSQWVYMYRSGAGEWVLGFETPTPSSQVLEITYVPTIPDLVADSDYPVMVPFDFHHLIPMRAAMMAKGTENRMNEAAMKEYVYGESLMLGELQSLQAHVSQRF